MEAPPQPKRAPGSPPTPPPEFGWRRPRLTPSLAEAYRSIPVAHRSWWRKAIAFAGPGYLVAVGYMDPGNWATDLAGGSAFGYTLLSVVLLSNLMAVLLQGLACKLGIVTGRDLAQACRDHYPRPVVWFLWIICEIAIAACDLAEVIGSAIALNLLFHIPLMVGVVLTALDVLVVLCAAAPRVPAARGVGGRARRDRSGLAFFFELVVSRPDMAGVIARLHSARRRSCGDPEMLYIAIGILGATVMPHNLYLHSSIVQTRKYAENADGKREAVRFAFLDSTIALTFALFINARHPHRGRGDLPSPPGTHGVAEIQDAYKLLTPLLGVAGARAPSSRWRCSPRAELDADRHARRPDRHGGVPRTCGSVRGCAG